MSKGRSVSKQFPFSLVSTDKPGLSRPTNPLIHVTQHVIARTTLAVLVLAFAVAMVHASPVQVVRFTTADGVEIVADFRSAPDAAQPAPVAILLHMYSSNRSAWRPLAEALHESGFAILAIDMRGHGESGGPQRDALAARMRKRDPALFQAMHRDAAAAHTWLSRQPECDTSRVAVIGASIGCSVAIDYASRDRSVDVVVALTPGTNYLEVDSTKPIVAIGKRPVLLLATERERKATDTLSQLNPNTIGEIVASGLHHGTDMFGTVDGIEGKIVEFVRRGVGEPTSKPVVSHLGASVYYEDESSLPITAKSGRLDPRKYSSAAEAEARGLKPSR